MHYFCSFFSTPQS